VGVSINAGAQLGYCPVGGIIAWHKNINIAPLQLPFGWIECNGQLITEGSLIGLTAPDLNAAGNRFLMGYATSGTTGDTSNHNHDYSGTTASENQAPTGAGPSSGAAVQRHTHNYSGTTTNKKVLPPYFTVVWIMRTI
jgi:hypothetical protein